jgi:hypothetical protein
MRLSLLMDLPLLLSDDLQVLLNGVVLDLGIDSPKCLHGLELQPVLVLEVLEVQVIELDRLATLFQDVVHLLLVILHPFDDVENSVRSLGIGFMVEGLSLGVDGS